MSKTIYKQLVAIILLLLSISTVYGKEKDEIALIEKQINSSSGVELYELKAKLSRLYYRYEPQKTISLAQEVMDYANSTQNNMLLEKAYVRFAIGNYVAGNLDSSMHYSLMAIEVNKLTNDTEEKEYALNLISLLYKRFGQYQSAIEYGEKTLDLRRKRNDTIGVAGSLGNLATMYQNIGEYNKAADYLYESLHIFESIGDTISIIGRLQSLYYLKKRLKLEQDALTHLSRAIKLSKKIDYPMQLAELHSNLSFYYKEIQEYDSALYFENLALQVYIKHNSKQSIATSYLSFAKLYEKKESLEAARPYYYKAIKIYSDNNLLPNLNILYENLGLNYLNSEMTDSAEYCFLLAYNSAKEINQAQVVKYTARDLHDLYKSGKNYEKALFFHEIYKHFQDSIDGGQTKQKIAELDVKYQSVKKEQEIMLLQKEKEAEKLEKEILKSRQQLYFIAITALILLFIIAIIAFIIKRNKNKQIQIQKDLVHNQEKELVKAELEKQKIIETELNTKLEYKSKQLTSHALNMMKKNQFLQEMEGDILNISKQSSDEVKTQLRRLNTLVKRNNKSEKDWELFKNYFEEVNQGFYDNLNVKFPGLSSNDYKLCALVKLNMNIKESASVLNISPESVKTARYRLRKKLNMKADEDLHEFIARI